MVAVNSSIMGRIPSIERQWWKSEWWKRGNKTSLLHTCVVFVTLQHIDCWRMFWNKTCYSFKYPRVAEWIISEMLKPWGLIFSKKSSKFDADSYKAIKRWWNVLVFKVNAFELVAVNSPCHGENTLHQQTML